jgi:hypothetical protein
MFRVNNFNRMFNITNTSSVYLIVLSVNVRDEVEDGDWTLRVGGHAVALLLADCFGFTVVVQERVVPLFRSV